ncbi:Ltp family lipoprotein [Lysinibacillus xylanilyticus]|uniref:Ltp family lipoprotein n=1 Tax=Lysinibacillus xylanilyticus TaxID=582475 RepID=UPI0038160F88
MNFGVCGENGIEKDSSVSLIFKDGKLNTIQQYGLIIEKETEEEKGLAEQKTKEEAEAKAKIENAPREHKLALQKAERYASTVQMSKAGIYDQLTSEYGEKFPADAAQFAIDNIVFDWKGNALKKAQLYAEKMSMSDSAIYDQLISSYGEKFTPEEAQYAIDNLK